jgi:hypothetical protein
MAATTNSTYQKILANHIANNPPNCDPQRSNENFTVYYNRITAQGLKPDIGANESDSDYLIRLATYQPATPSSSYSLQALSASFATYYNDTLDTVLSASFATFAANAKTAATASFVLSSSIHNG